MMIIQRSLESCRRSTRCSSRERNDSTMTANRQGNGKAESLSPVSPLQHQKEYPCEGLAGCRKTVAKSYELVDLPLKRYELGKVDNPGEYVSGSRHLSGQWRISHPP